MHSRSLVRSSVCACLLCVFASPAGLLPGNVWPNPTLETDSNSDGIPDFWNKGGSNPNIESWTTATFVSASHSFMLSDSSTNDRMNDFGWTTRQSAPGSMVSAISCALNVNAISPLRVSKEAELEGLDVPEFGMPAYPDGEVVS